MSRFRRVVTRVDRSLSSRGDDFRRLLGVNAASTAADTLVAIALAGTLFFSVPAAEARANVALYLLVTLAPFAVLAPALGSILARVPTAYRHGLIVSGAMRAVVALVLAPEVDSFWLFPLTFLLLVLSRLFAISRASLLPVALDRPESLVSANATLAQTGVVAGALAAPIGIGAAQLLGPWSVLVLAAVAAAASAAAAAALPTPPAVPQRRSAPSLRRVVRGAGVPARVRYAQLATAGVRLLNGFLLLLLAFAFRESSAGLLDFGAILAAAGAGYFIAAIASPWLERRLREEPMVVVALAVEAAAAFIAAERFGIGVAAALATAAGTAWGTAKFAFDGLLQSSLPPDARGIAFTRSETVFAIAWVVGALIPVGLPVPVGPGLSVAGLVALGAQVVYVTGLLVPARQVDRDDDQQVADTSARSVERVR